MYRNVIARRDFSLLERELLRKIGEIRAEDGSEKIDILTGSNQLGEYLKRRLAEESQILFNIDFITFPDLVRKIIGRSRPPSSAPLPPFAWKVLIDGIVSSGIVPESLKSIAGTRGFSSSLNRTFTDLAEAGVSRQLANSLSADGRLGLPVHAADVLSVYSEFRDRIEAAGGDIHSEFAEAADIVRREGHDTLTMAYGFYDLNEEQWRLLSAILRQGRMLLFVPYSEEDAYSYARRLIIRCSGSGMEIDSGNASSSAGTGPVSPELLSMKDDEDEYKEIARRIIAHAGSGEYRFEDIKVIILPGTEKKLLSDIFEEAEIPFNMTGGLDASYSSLARGILGLAGLLGGKVRRVDLVEFLSSAPLDVPADGGCGPDPVSVWIRKSAEEGMTGENGWVNENRALLEKFSKEVKRGKECSESESAVRFVARLIEKITKADDSFSSFSSWSDFARHFFSLVSGIFRDTEDMPSISLILERIAGLDRISVNVSQGQFLAVLRDSLGSAVLRSPNRSKAGVQVLSLGMARGLRAKVIFIPSLTEGSIPGIVRQDPYLKDIDRTVLEKAAGGEIVFSKKSERTIEQALLFRLICDSASERLYCSRPRTDSATGRDVIESSFVRFLKERFDGAGGASSLVEVRVPGKIRSIEETEPLTESEFDMLLLVSDRNRGIEAISNRFFSKGMKLSRERWQENRLTPFDAVFRSSEAISESRRMLEKKNWSFSATSLEGWARCPFAYFLEKVLEVESLPEPERILTIDRRDRGRLVHSILEAIFRKFLEKGMFPLSEKNRANILRIASGAIEETLGRFGQENPVGIHAFWEMEMEWIRSAVVGYVEGEIQDECDMRPERFEESFGGESGSEVSFKTGKREIFFHGRIDRIDRGNGGRFMVVDYKTGDIKGKKSGIAGGTSLQLPVYLLAAARLLGLPVEQGAALYRQIAPDSRASVQYGGEDWAEKRAGFSDTIDLITGGIEKGYFFIYPDSNSCRFCGYKGACPSARENIFSRKCKADRLCDEFMNLRGSGGDD